MTEPTIIVESPDGRPYTAPANEPADRQPLERDEESEDD